MRCALAWSEFPPRMCCPTIADADPTSLPSGIRLLRRIHRTLWNVRWSAVQETGVPTNHFRLCRPMFYLHVTVDEVHRKLPELGQELPPRSVRRGEAQVRIARHGHRSESSLTLADGFEHGGALCPHAEVRRRGLYVAPGEAVM